MELTEWFEPHTKPTMVGVYEVRWGVGSPIYRYWSGSVWHVGCDTVSKAANRAHIASFHQNIGWRGLRSNPNIDP